MVRELTHLAADLGAPIVRVFAAWSGVSRRDGCITYDVARANLECRYPGTTALERWCTVRDCLAESARWAQATDSPRGYNKKRSLTFSLVNPCGTTQS